MRRAFAVLALGIFFLTASLRADSPTPFQTYWIEEPVPYSDKKIDLIVQDAMLKNEVIGAALGIVQNGQITYLKGYGWADRDQYSPVAAKRTMFRWASISKTLTAVASIKAALSGQIDLDRNVSEYYPNYTRPDSWVRWTSTPAQGLYELIKITSPLPITMRMLLGHTSGIQHYENGLAQLEPSEVLTGDQKINTGFEWPLSYWMTAPLVSVPGELYNYTTVGYNLAGVVLEKATGTSLFSMVRNAVALPYGMTTLQPDYQWAQIPDRATGYVKNEITGAVETDTNTDVSWKLPGGGFISTTEDLAKYCKGMMDAKAGLTPQERRLLWTSLIDKTGKATDYGLGFMVKTVNARTKVYHSGLQEKARTLMVMYPDEGLCLVMMSNSQYAEPKEILNSIETELRSRSSGH